MLPEALHANKNVARDWKRTLHVSNTWHKSVTRNVFSDPKAYNYVTRSVTCDSKCYMRPKTIRVTWKATGEQRRYRWPEKCTCDPTCYTWPEKWSVSRQVTCEQKRYMYSLPPPLPPLGLFQVSYFTSGYRGYSLCLLSWSALLSVCTKQRQYIIIVILHFEESVFFLII